MQDERSVIVSPAPFRAPRILKVPHGQTVREIVCRMYDSVPPAFRDFRLIVEVDGVPVPRERWDLVPEVNQHVLVSVPVHGGGGKDPLRTLLTIAVVVAAVATGQLYGATIAGSLGVTSAAGVSTVTALTSAAVMTAGAMLVNALAPIRAPELSGGAQSYADSPTYSLSGARNAAQPFGSVPVILGRHRFYPPLGSRPYTEILGNDEYLRMLFIWGYGPLSVTDIKIGDTPIEQYADVVIETLPGSDDDPDPTLVSSFVHQEGIGVLLTQAGGQVVRTAPEGVDEISVDLVFPYGLAYISDSGARTNHTVNVKLEYREVGSGTWIDLSTSIPIAGGAFAVSWFGNWTFSVYVHTSGYVSVERGTAEIDNSYRIAQFYTLYDIYGLQTFSHAEVTGCTVTVTGEAEITVAAGSVLKTSFNVTDATSSALRVGRHWVVDRTKRYEVALTRITADTDEARILDDVHWATMRGFRNDAPVQFLHPLAMTAVRIRATEQLQGVIDSLNAVVTSVCPVWSGTAWGAAAETQNPAALFRHVLMHNANARPRTAAQIDDAALGEWYEFCEDEGFKFNMVRDFKSSVWDVLADIAAAGRAAPTLTDGKWGVVMDTDERPVVQHITPRNSWGFSSEKVLYDRPHGFRARFINEDNNYQQDERTVYDDGYSVANATRFEGIEFPGVTDPDLVWRFGRFHIAQARLRPELYSLYQDFEHLVVRRGSKVRVSHDVPLWGSGWGRVKELITTGSPADTITGVVLDEKVVMEAGHLYACRFRLADEDNTSLVLSVDTEAGETDTLTLSASVPLADGPAVGDLAMFGEAARETAELLVKSIERAGDYTARLLLVDAGAGIYGADTGEIPDFDSMITVPSDIARIAPAAPSISGVQSGAAALEYIGGGVRARMLVTVSPGVSAVRVNRYRLRWRVSGTALWSVAETPVSIPTVAVSDVTEGAAYELQAQAVSIYDIDSVWSEPVSHVVVGQSEPPADVTGFSCNIVGTTAFLSWSPVADIDLSHYRIRWSANAGTSSPGPTWTEAVDLVERVGRPATSVSAPAMAGTYMIKAVDYAGNESESAALAITSLAQIYGLNFVESIVEPASPPWVGTPDGADYNEALGGIALLPDPDAGGGGDPVEEDYAVATGYNGYWIQGASFIGSATDNLYFGNFGSGQRAHTYLVFQNVDIPQGATITSAKVELYCSWAQSGTTCNANVHFNDADDAAAPTNLSEADGLALTDAVAWDGIGAWSEGTTYETPDLAEILQAVVDRAGWAEGNNVMAVIKDNLSSSGAYRAAGIANPITPIEAHLVVEYEPPSVVLPETGYYELTEVIDLGSPVQSRISASLTVTGEDLLDDLYELPDLYTAGNLYGAQEGGYSASLEIRSTNDDPDGSPPADWTDWQTLVIGYYGARAYQFRLRLDGTPPGVTPIVTALTVQVDMEDRVAGFSANVPVEGATITFSPAFYVTPQIGVTVLDGQEGDAYTVTDLDETGFGIAFTNGGSPVERNISGIAKGYGFVES